MQEKNVVAEVRATAQRLAAEYIQREILEDRMRLIDRSMNMNRDDRVFFVHNPKCMGTSMKAWLGMRTDNADHNFPSLQVSRKTWETWRTVLVVRHPIDRFVSSYNFHCRSNYSGGYLRKFPQLKSMTMEQYFATMVKDAPLVVAPQWKYAVHLESDQPVDHIIHFEAPGPDLDRLAMALNRKPMSHHLNRNTSSKVSPSPELQRELEAYYARDFEAFGY